MGAASWEQPDHGQAEEQDIANSVSSPDPPPNDAIRSWLLRGIHTFGIDPRRLGGRGDARRVLGEDRRLAPGAGGGWRETVSALQRHTIHNALTHLSPEERQVVNLAYLEGRTNRQIAAVLGVSVSTVRRRLWLALDHLDEYVRRTGTWVSSILLLGLVYLIDRAARLGRSASPGEWPHKLAATVAVGTVAAAGVGLVAANQHSSTSQHSPPPAIARLIPSLPGATNSLTTLLPLAPGTAAPITPSIAAVHSSTTPAAKVIKAASNTNHQSRQGDSTSEQSDQVDKSAPVVTVKSDSDRGPAANRSKRGHSRVMTGEDRSDT